MGLNNPVEQGASNEAKFTVDSCSCATDVVPACTSVVRKSWVGVLEVGNSNKPVVDPKVWSEIPDGHVGEAELLAEQDEASNDDSKTEVTEEDELSILGFEKRTSRVEVIDTSSKSVDLSFSASLTLTFVVVVASNIPKQVHGPAENLLSDGMDDGSDWGFLGQLVDLVN